MPSRQRAPDRYILRKVIQISIRFIMYKLFARCTAPTCMICSRTCTASVTSRATTPSLTWSTTPSPAHSPRRSALSLHNANTNTNFNTNLNTNTNFSGKRKHGKADDGKADDENVNNGGTDRDESLIKPGCGRTFCKNCCFEDFQKSVAVSHLRVAAEVH